MNAAAPTPVVLLHASGSSARQWTQAVAALEAPPARLRVHALDFHGHGGQPPWRGDAPMTLAHEVARVEALLKQVGPAHIVGHSYGAAVALKLAHTQPARVRSVIAFEPVLFRLLRGGDAPDPDAHAVRATVDFMACALAAGQAPAAARRFMDFWSGAGSWDTLAPARQQSAAERVPVLLSQFDALFGDSMGARQLASLRMPVLLLSGERTVETARALMRHLRAALPHAQHEVLPDMGHMGPVTHAAAFNRRLVDVLAGHVARAAESGADRGLSAWRRSRAAQGAPDRCGATP